jgi:hypothetical protein
MKYNFYGDAKKSVQPKVTEMPQSKYGPGNDIGSKGLKFIKNKLEGAGVFVKKGLTNAAD